MSGGSEGFTDLHSHLVPGVDDGCRTLDEAREGIRRMRAVGVRKVVTTPHLNGSLTRDRGMLEDRLTEVDRGWRSLKAMAEVDFAASQS